MTLKDGVKKIKNWFDTVDLDIFKLDIERDARKKVEVRPWEEIPEGEGTMGFFGESAPDWKETDYLKAAKGWVYACVAAISDDVATIELKLYRKTTKGIEEVEDHSLIDLLYRVNNFTTKFDHWWSTQQYLELTGEAPWLLNRSGEKGEPTEIYLLRPDKLTIKFDKTGEKIIDKYIYQVSPQHKEEFDKNQILFIKYPNPLRPFRGMGTLEAAARTVDLDKYAEEWNVNFFYNAARPDAVLTTQKTLTPEQIERLKDQWKKQFRGIDKVAKLAILEGGLEYKQLQLSQKDMDFLAQQRFSRDKIFAIFRVPKTILGMSEDVNRANAETAAYTFAKWTIKPKMQRLIEQLNEFLVPMFGDDLFLSFTDPVPENTELKIKRHIAALGPSGWLTVNEVREEEGREPVDGGDVIYRPMAMIPAGESPGEMKEVIVFARKKKGSKEKKKTEYGEMIKSLNARQSFKKKGEVKIEKAIKETIKTFLRKEGEINNQKQEKNTIKKNFRPKEIIDLERFWKKQIEIEERYEKKLLVKLRDIFSIQERETIARLEGLSKGILAKGFGDDDYYQRYWTDMKLNIPSVLLNRDKESKKMAIMAAPILKDGIMAEGQYALDEMEMAMEFAESKAVTNYLNKYPIKFAKSVNKNTNLKLRKTLTEGVVEGESITKLTTRVRTVFDVASKSRAISIARTEVSRATNFATVEAYKQSGVVEGKKWLTAFDERTCSRCSAMNNKVVDVDKSYFKQGDEFMDLKFDYDDVSQPPLHIKCRCTVTPVIIE